MNVEQRLVEAFRASEQVEPTPDLFSRVVHSIEEDRRHRTRVVRTTILFAAVSAAMIGAGAVAIVDSRAGRIVHRPTLEVLEAVALVLVLGTLGPAIRRFGRNYAADLWPAGASLPAAMLRLLDLAYYLVGTGYLLLTVEFEFGDRRTGSRLADQLAGAAERIGGLLLALGVLHAATLFLLPLIALIDNSTRRSRPLARWVILLVVLIGVAMFQLGSMATILVLSD